MNVSDDLAQIILSRLRGGAYYHRDSIRMAEQLLEAQPQTNLLLMAKIAIEYLEAWCVDPESYSVNEATHQATTLLAMATIVQMAVPDPALLTAARRLANEPDDELMGG